MASRSMSMPTPEHSASMIAVPTIPPWLISLAALPVRPRQSPQQLQVTAQALGWRRCGCLPIVERFAVASAMVDGGDQQVARLGVEAGQQPLGPPEDRDRQLATIGSDIRMSADDRDAQCGRRCAHAVQHGGRAVLPLAQTASTTATGLPPIAATSEILTMTPHQPANHGSAATNSLIKPSIANSRNPSHREWPHSRHPPILPERRGRDAWPLCRYRPWPQYRRLPLTARQWRQDPETFRPPSSPMRRNQPRALRRADSGQGPPAFANAAFRRSRIPQ